VNPHADLPVLKADRLKADRRVGTKGDENVIPLVCHSRLSGIFPKDKKDSGQARMTETSKPQ
jgi:hypothetical protein